MKSKGYTHYQRILFALILHPSFDTYLVVIFWSKNKVLTCLCCYSLLLTRRAKVKFARRRFCYPKWLITRFMLFISGHIVREKSTRASSLDLSRGFDKKLKLQYVIKNCLIVILAITRIYVRCSVPGF